ncbi:MAG: hypothetical protein ACRBB6_09000 [Neptuniibacter sp.]
MREKLPESGSMMSGSSDDWKASNQQNQGLELQLRVLVPHFLLSRLR